MADAQTEEQRLALKAEKRLKEQMKAAEQLEALEIAARGPFELPGSVPASPELDYGSTRLSKSSRPRLFSFKRSRTGSSNPTSPDMAIQEGVEFNMASISLPLPALDLQPTFLQAFGPSNMGSPISPTDIGLGLMYPIGHDQGSLDTSPHSPTKSHILVPSPFISSTPSSPEFRGQRFTMSGAASSANLRTRQGSRDSIRASSRPPSEEEPKRTWADRFLLGGSKTTGSRATVDKDYARSIVQGRSRRHSFDSGETRASFKSGDSRRFSEAPSVTAKRSNTLSRRTSWATANELPYGLTNGYDESYYVPPSTMLLELFVSLLNEFDSTPKLFDYARRAIPRHFDGSRESSILSSLHPGKPVVLDPELEDMKALVKDRVWFLLAVKWQYFGRVLFSPGHHLLQLGKAGYGTSRPSTAEELRVLDLDGPITGNFVPIVFSFFLC